MRFLNTVGALVPGVVLAGPLATITPCASAPSLSAIPIIVTAQHQTVSTCFGISACFQGTCTTRYSLDTFAYVSTVIPAAWDGTSIHATTVTSTTQTVTVSRFRTTITKLATATSAVIKNGTTSHAPPKPVYLTVAKDFMVAYNKMGPLAIPGYGGSGLCKECNVHQDGSRSQVVNVIECRSGLVGAKCMGYAETWISMPASASSSTTLTPLSTRFVAPSAGTFTFTFTLTAPSHIVTAGVKTITLAPSPYFHHIVRECHRPREIIDFTIVVTKTISWTLPCLRQPPRTSSTVPLPTGNHVIPGFRDPGNRPSSPVDDLGGDAYDWTSWGGDDVVKPSLPLSQDWRDWTPSQSQSVPSAESTGGSPISSLSPTSGSTSISYTMSSLTGVTSGTMATSSVLTRSVSPTADTTSTSASLSLPQSSMTITAPVSGSSAATTREVTSSSSSGAGSSTTSSMWVTTVNTASFSGGPPPDSSSTLTLNSTSSSSTSPISISTSIPSSVTASGLTSLLSSSTSSVSSESFSGAPISRSTSSITSTTTSTLLIASTTTSSFSIGPISRSTTDSFPSNPTGSTIIVATPILATTSLSSTAFLPGAGSSSTSFRAASSGSGSSGFSSRAVPDSTAISLRTSSIASPSPPSTNPGLPTTTSISSSTSIVPDTSSSASPSSLTSSGATTTSTSSTSNASVGPIGGSTSTHSSTGPSSISTVLASLTSTSTSVVDASIGSASTSFSLTTSLTTQSTVTSASSFSTISATSPAFIGSSTSSLSSTTSSTQIVPAPHATGPFFITTNSPLRTRKRTVQYLGVSDGIGTLFSDSSAASRFFLDTAGYLRTDSFYVDSNLDQPYLTFSLITTINGRQSKWFIDSTGLLLLQAEGSGFCVNELGVAFVLFGSATPFICLPVILQTTAVIASK
ncbi:hypothetical protein AYO21_10871 [Fonsecaea monophora]|uniref:DUF7908 domain-containing protein n=1 Tax=Fonsecaea monophora TaxID=254056 RepID=A0A177ESK7_9EURO|nr:hypothetical protein AYO21_10871 [Fonsecaea monophora]OAG34984.1 hypothetical protein AYO21_10871 [Fonsecaea monophora]